MENNDQEQNELIDSLNDDYLFAGLSIDELEKRLTQEALEERLELACGAECGTFCVWN